MTRPGNPRVLALAHAITTIDTAATLLDDLRTRHQCAVMLEHHAPHGDTLGRKLRPVGSSAWMRWPELGISMDPDRDRHPGSMTLGRFRGDRSSNSWPQRLDRGNRWPWVGRWDDNPGDMT